MAPPLPTAPLPQDPTVARLALNARLAQYADDPQTSRLGMTFPARLAVCSTVSLLAGGALGLAKGSQESGLRFRAENSHRFPSTQTGWYLYHKSKNYHMALGGVFEGAKMAAWVGIWVGVFMAMEESVDRGRAGVVAASRRLRGNQEGDFRKIVEGQRDFGSSVLAGLGTAGAFGAWNRLPIPTMARLARIGAKVGLAFGVAQDVIGLLKGRRLGYVEFVQRHVLGRGEEDGAGAGAGAGARGANMGAGAG
jgi:hypothetical protein